MKSENEVELNFACRRIVNSTVENIKHQVGEQVQRFLEQFDPPTQMLILKSYDRELNRGHFSNMEVIKEHDDGMAPFSIEIKFKLTTAGYPNPNFIESLTGIRNVERSTIEEEA